MTRKRYLSSGFTLIELLVTVAIIVILAALAAPSLNEFAVKSRISSVGNEFTSSVLKARNEAISKNTCVTMCMSSTVDDATPACKTSDSDWQVGWIVFLNPSCNSGSDTPTAVEDILLARQSIGGDYFLNSQANTRKLMFNSRGYPNLSGGDRFNIVYKASNDPLTDRYAFNICIDQLGRTLTIATTDSCP
jgi:type IV fimbrial biogenesis protein FimT